MQSYNLFYFKNINNDNNNEKQQIFSNNTKILIEFS
jgi:hypothetical protein